MTWGLVSFAFFTCHLGHFLIPTIYFDCLAIFCLKASFFPDSMATLALVPAPHQSLEAWWQARTLPARAYPRHALLIVLLKIFMENQALLLSLGSNVLLGLGRRRDEQLLLSGGYMLTR